MSSFIATEASTAFTIIAPKVGKARLASRTIPVRINNRINLSPMLISIVSYNVSLLWLQSISADNSDD